MSNKSRHLLSLLCIVFIALMCVSQASARMTSASFAVGRASDVLVPNDGDGAYKQVRIGGRLAYMGPGFPAAGYMYFQAPVEMQRPVPGDLYVTVEFYDSFRQVFNLQYDDGISPYSLGPQGVTAGAKTWVRQTFKLPNARLSRSQNMNADFRIAAPSGLAISRMEVSWKPRKLGSRPSEKERTARLKNAGRPDGMEYTFGNDADEGSAYLYKSLGVTSIESYVTWETVERNGKGEWEWSKWDRQVEILQETGLKWVPFLIVGPAYSTPEWYRTSAEHMGIVCLEHNTKSKIESLWSPHLPYYIDRFLAEFANRYRDTGVLESVLLGIQGDFGEAIYPVFGGGWTFIIPGEYHTHPGFWCGDEYALKSFREWAVAKYGSVDKVNSAWGTSWNSVPSINFPAKGEAAIKRLQESLPSAPATTKRQWLDFVDWYRGEMTRFSDWWIETTKKHFPDTPIYLCTGGHAPPEHGANFAAQCKVAAKHGAGVRITNEASVYADNFVMTRWVAAAGRHYGAFFGFEPAGGEDEKGIVARIYNATASGAIQLHDYNNNVVESQSRLDAQQKHMKYLKKREPIVDVALWYPNTAMSIKWGDLAPRAAAFRDIVDYDFVDEDMLRDGALDRYKILAIIYGDIIEESDFEIIEQWTRKGGVVLLADRGPIKTVEGSVEPHNRLFGGGADVALGEGRAIVIPQSSRQNDELAAALSEAMTSAGIAVADGEPDGVYATLIKPDEVLFLNTTDADVKKTIVLPGSKRQEVVAAANTITEVKIER